MDEQENMGTFEAEGPSLSDMIKDEILGGEDDDVGSPPSPVPNPMVTDMVQETIEEMNDLLESKPEVQCSSFLGFLF